jgi:hypothetical protein
VGSNVMVKDPITVNGGTGTETTCSEVDGFRYRCGVCWSSTQTQSECAGSYNPARNRFHGSHSLLIYL